jgi:uncharacterized protein (DUF1499 family)
VSIVSLCCEVDKFLGTSILKILTIIIASLVLLAIVAFSVLGFMSQSGQASGLAEGKLANCPGTPNCICSEYPADVDHYIEPLVYSEQNVAVVLPRLNAIIRQMGGSLLVEQADYLVATFISSIFRFVDDLEIRIDTVQKMIHLRSASRVGHGDRGVNRKRVEQLKKLFHLQTG